MYSSTEKQPAVEVIVDKARITSQDVAAVFATAPWTSKRALADIEKMLANTSVVALARMGAHPVGFARALTDFTFRAFVEDVIVVPNLRARGIGRQIMLALEAEIWHAGVPRIELTTNQAGFWEKLGYAVKPGTTYLVKYPPVQQ